MRRTGKAIGTIAAAMSLALVGGGLAVADTLNISQAEVTVAPGGSTTFTIGITATSDEGDVNGCNTGGTGNDVTVSFTSSNSAKVPAPASATITDCDDPGTAAVEGGATVTVNTGSSGVHGDEATISAVASGGKTVVRTRHGVTTTTNSSYTTDSVLVKIVAPNTAPAVAVTGVASNETYEAGSVPPAGCSVIDAEDGNSTPAPRISGSLNAEGVGTQTAACSYTDGGGLHGSASASYTIADTTAPSLSGMPADIVAEASSASGATVSWTAPTAGGRTGETRSVNCTPASASTFALGETPVSCTASDGSGNESAAQSFKVTVWDTTAPTLRNMPADQVLTATSASGAVATWTPPTATDSVDSAATTSCSASSGVTFGLGTTTVSCTASDAAGNTSAAQQFSVNVTYSATGALQPINSNGSSIFKLGSTVPVKFDLTGASDPVVDAVATVHVAKVSAGLVGSEAEAISSTTASTGNVFRYDSTSGQYIYNYGTKGLSDGTYQIRIDLGDGVKTRTVNISLKK